MSLKNFIILFVLSMLLGCRELVPPPSLVSPELPTSNATSLSTPSPSPSPINSDCQSDHSSSGQNFFVDPVNGTSSGDGSKQSPWRTLSEVVQSTTLINGHDRSSGVVHAGDTICLLDGNHGSVQIPHLDRYNNTDFITIMAYPGQHPTLNNLVVNQVGYWAFRGLTFQNPPNPASGSYLAFFNKVQNIVFDHNTLMSQADVSAWSASDWIALGANGIKFSGTNSSFTYNTLKNVRFGIGLDGDQITVAHNTIDYFVDDAIDVSSSNTLIQNNTLTNHYGGVPDGNHGDFIQGFAFGSGLGVDSKGVTKNLTVDSNILIASTGTYPNIPAVPAPSTTCIPGTPSTAVPSPSPVCGDEWGIQGISAGPVAPNGIVQGQWENVSVTNNLVEVTVPNGLWFFGVHHLTIENNTVVNLGTVGYGFAWISVIPYRQTGVINTEVTVRNNIADLFSLNPLDDFISVDHNIALQNRSTWGSNNGNNTVASPDAIFVDYSPLNGKYALQLKASSSNPALGAGSAVNAPALDVLGYPRNPKSVDLGAYAAP